MLRTFNNLMIMFEFILKSLDFDCRICILLNLSSLWHLLRSLLNLSWFFSSGVTWIRILYFLYLISSLSMRYWEDIEILKRYIFCFFLTDRRSAMKGRSEQKEYHSASFLLSIFLHWLKPQLCGSTEHK